MNCAASAEKLCLASLGTREFHGGVSGNTPGEAGDAAATDPVCSLLLTGTCRHPGRRNLGFKGEGGSPVSLRSECVPADPAGLSHVKPRWHMCPGTRKIDGASPRVWKWAHGPRGARVLWATKTLASHLEVKSRTANSGL